MKTIEHKRISFYHPKKTSADFILPFLKVTVLASCAYGLWVGGQTLFKIETAPVHQNHLPVVSQVKTSQPSVSPLAKLGLDLQNEFKNYSAIHLNEFINSEQEIRITLKSDPIFNPGTASLNFEIVPEFRKFVEFLLAHPLGVNVSIESHTDSSPIVRHRRLYKSNWQLSAARAASLAMMFTQLHFPKKNIVASGFAESRPLVRPELNSDINRRIVIRVFQTRNGKEYETKKD